MVQPIPEGSGKVAIERAIALVTEAMDVLDAHVDCPDAAAHLDVALRRLRQYLITDSDGK